MKVVVIGSGPGGYVAAIRAAQLGCEVTVVEKKWIGGTCLNVGCIPVKSLLASAEVLENARKAEAFGVKTGTVSFDLTQMMARKEKVVKQLTGGIKQLFKSNRVESITGEGEIVERGRVKVNGTGGEKVLTADQIIVATGSEAARPSFIPFDGERIVTSDEVLSLTRVPESLLVIGAGAVGIEFSCLFANLGSKVTLVEMMSQILPTEDLEITSVLQKELEKQGITVKTGVKIESIVKENDGGITTTLAGGEKWHGKMVLAAVGRSLNSRNIGLATAGIKCENGRIMVNERMQTNAAKIYAVGDVTGGILLAHKASKEGIIAAENIACRDSIMEYQLVPRCIFSFPEVAAVGMTEKEASASGVKIKCGRFPFRALGRAWAMGRVEGMVKLVIDSGTGEILGGHIVGPHATDLIGEIAVAMKAEATIEILGDTIHGHPTLSEALMEACHAAMGEAIHLP